MTDKITKAEFEVMDVLWSESPLAASEIAERLAKNVSWSQRTVKTLLSRLVEKGAINHEPDGRRFLYRPILQRETYAQNMTSRLADKLFGGRAAPLVAHLAEGRGLTESDIKELEALIKDLKRDGR
ncbi:MAG: transcriptional regulator [Hyphococcus sp.]|nr:MAG: transcriptional regulator [Marinicaulis sp.]